MCVCHQNYSKCVVHWCWLYPHCHADKLQTYSSSLSGTPCSFICGISFSHTLLGNYHSTCFLKDARLSRHLLQMETYNTHLLMPGVCRSSMGQGFPLSQGSTAFDCLLILEFICAFINFSIPSLFESLVVVWKCCSKLGKETQDCNLGSRRSRI